ncbi:PAS domain S-box protein, partial [Candidatus Poribacteria bacterium]|nr:PAS domain S-box protein [Candidatus Poribacteria bacterium]
MTYPELCSKVEHLQKRISSLRDAASKGRKRSKEAEAEVLLDELSTALEELQAAQEELHQKSEEIVSTHHAAEQERLRYQELFEFAPGGYLVTDSSGTILEANRQAASLLNITPESLCGKPLSVFIAKDERAIFFSRFSELAHGGGTREWETRLQPCKKQAFHASLTAAAARDPEGEVTGFRWLVVDITDRKQTEKELTQHRTILEELVGKCTAELEEGQRSIRFLFEESDVGMAYIDREHRYVAMNRSLAEINGLSQETHRRVTLEEVLGADSPVIRMVDELFRAGNPVHRKRLPVSVTNRKDRQPGY